MDPLVGSALISTGGSLLGSVLGGGEKRPRYRDALQAQKYATMNDFDVRMDAAKKHGLHPLVALGQNPGTGASFNIGGSSGGSSDSPGAIAERLGQGVSRAYEAHASKEDRASARMASALQLENMQLQNDRLRSEISLLGAPGSPPGLADRALLPGQSDSALHVPQEFYKALNTPLGVGGNSPMHQYAVNDRGERVRVMNPDMGDNEFLMAAHALGYTLPDWLKNMGRRVHGAVKRSKQWDRQAVSKHRSR